MKAPAFTIVHTTQTAGQADMMIAALQAAGMHPVELDRSSHFTLASADVSFHVEVPTEEAEEARNFLKSYDLPEDVT